MDDNGPWILEAVEFGDLNGIPEQVVRDWYGYLETRKWIIGGAPVRNWRGALVNWNKRRTT